MPRLARLASPPPGLSYAMRASSTRCARWLSCVGVRVHAADVREPAGSAVDRGAPSVVEMAPAAADDPSELEAELAAELSNPAHPTPPQDLMTSQEAPQAAAAAVPGVQQPEAGAETSPQQPSLWD